MSWNKAPWRERFWKHVSKTDECWNWTAHVRPCGHGTFIIAELKIQLAHRASWVLHYGVIPEGKHVLHRCDNPRCVRPDHLYIGTHLDNMRDMRARGRCNPPRGPRWSKASLATRQEIKARYLAGGITQLELARAYGISTGLVWKIVHDIGQALWRKEEAA